MTELDDLLRSRGIYPIGNYGWLNEDDIDPDEAGHAMWQVDPPPGLDWTLRDVIKDDSQLVPWKKAAATAGVDFDGLMELSRLSIGLALEERQKLEPNVFASDKMFNLHWMSAMLNLEIASDRIRQFFVASVFQMVPEKHDLQSSKHRRYLTPFSNAEAMLSNSPDEMLRKSVCALPAYAIRNFEHIKVRNDLVHIVATDIARLTKKRLETPPVRVAEIDLREPQLERMAANAKQTIEQRLETRIDQCISWYKLLVELSNHAFIVEHQQRSKP